MPGLSSILSLVHKEFNEFNKTVARMLDSFLSYDINITLKSHFWCENDMILSLHRCNITKYVNF